MIHEVNISEGLITLVQDLHKLYATLILLSFPLCRTVQQILSVS